MALQMCYFRELYLSCVVCDVLTALCLVCVSRCVYLHLTDLLSESGAALRINTDTLPAHIQRTHTLSRSLSHLSVDRVFSISVGSPSSQADGEQSE